MATQSPDPHAIFNQALELPTDGDRSQYLDEACAGDPELQNRIEGLLRAHFEAGSFLWGKTDAPAETDVRPVTEQPGDTIGPYKLLQQIGEGGMGVVYMAEQTEPVERRVALKIIKPGMDTRQVIARFEAERQALAMMDHPNIARVLDAGTTDTGRPYFVMELVKGIAITEYCDEQHVTPRERLELFLPICQAVQHAHQKGVIHRDLKPSNILIAQYDDRAVPKIIDFGVAKAVSQRLTEKTMFTQYGQIVGTIEYMSPEQARFNQLDVDTRSDIYSLGVLLYELLTGETPFDKQRLRSAAFDELLRIIREEEPPRPSVKLSTCATLPSVAANRHIEPHKLSTLVRGELDWIVMKALEKDRGRRYETASAFAADVQHYLNDEAVVACPPSAAYRFRKFARRNRAAIGTTAAVAACLIVLAAASTVAAIRFERLANEKAELVEEKSVLAEDLQEALTDAQANLTLARDQERRANENLELARDQEHQARENLALVELEQKRAEGNLDLALEALDAVYIDAIGTEHLLTDTFRPLDADEDDPATSIAPVLTDLEIELLERGLRFYDRFAQDNADAPHATLQTAQAYYRVATFHAALDDDTSARTAYREAIRRFDSYEKAEVDSGEGQDAARNGDLFDVYYTRAKCHLELGNLTRAVDDADRALDLRADLADVWRVRGQARRVLDELAGAISDFTRAIALAENVPHSYYRLRGQAYLGRGDNERALEDFDRAVDLQPGYWVTLKRRAVALFRLGRFEESLADLTKALELNPDDATTLVWIPRFEVAECPDESFRRGLLSLADSAVQNTSKPEWAHLWRANLLLALGETEQAEHGLAKVAELAGENANLQLRLAGAWRELGIEDRALEHYSAAVELQPDEARYWNGRGMSHNRLKHYEQARDDFTRAIELDAAVSAFWSNRAVANFNLRDFELAAADASHTLELNPDSLQAHRTRAQARRALGQLEDAVADFRWLIERQSAQPEEESVTDWGHLSQALFRLGKYEEARDGLEKTIELRGDNGPSLDRGPRWWFYAMTLWRLGETERARELIEELEQLLTELPPARRTPQERLRAEAIELMGESSPGASEQRTASSDQ